MTGGMKLIEKWCRRPIAFRPAFVPLVGVNGALMLSQALYWSQRTTDPDGWFYKTQAEWREETGLTRHQQEGARAKLDGILLEKRAGVPGKLYYKVHFWALYNALKAVDEQRTSLSRTLEQDCTKVANLYTETTQQSTPSSTTESSGTNVPGAEAPLTVCEEEQRTSDFAEAWDLGLSILANEGMGEQQARTFLETYASYGEGKLADLIVEMAVEPPVDAWGHLDAQMQAEGYLDGDEAIVKLGGEYGLEPESDESSVSFRERVRKTMETHP